MKVKPLNSVLFSLLFLLLFACPSIAQEDRKLLFSTSLSPELQKIVARLSHSPGSPIDQDQLPSSPAYFVRIAPRIYILSSTNQLVESSADPNQHEAVLGTKPFVFLTSPEGLYGHSLLEIYAEIGYEAEDILRSQRNREMVAIVFRYPPPIVLSPEIKNGELPAAWEDRVYIPYWENIFSLFYHLADTTRLPPTKNGAPAAPEKTFQLSESERAFVLSYTIGAKERLTRLPYSEIKAFGGADWVYRKLLEDKLSVFEHFRGNGRTQNEISDPLDAQPGILEFIGPNKKIKELPEVAIIDLGKLIVEDTYRKAQ